VTVSSLSPNQARQFHRPEAVVIGASSGAIEALSAILPKLPSVFPLPIMVVVHMPPDNKSVIVDLFRSKCELRVKEAEDKESLQGGIVYFAPPDYHLLIEPDRRLSLSSEEPVHFSRPAIDVLFETAAEAFGSGLIGIILTGANCDGAQGLKAVLDAGGISIAQTPSLAHSPAMPQAALDACPIAASMSLEQIGTYLQEISPSE
jgi:two-component system chemotaxis response regulator CheB